MFGRPVKGGVDLNIGEEEYEVSYLTDIPRDFLTAMIFALKEDKDFCVWVELEYDTRMKIISDYYDTYLIINENLTVVKDINKWMLAMEMYDDFHDFFDEWCNLQFYKSEEELERFPESFLRLLENLSAILQNARLYLQNTEMYDKSRQKEFYRNLGKRRM